MSDEQALNRNRALAAEWFLQGEGIEIGALHKPLQVPAGITVRYVDRMPAADLRIQYPELADLPLVDPDIVDDGETLGRVDSGSQDFIIACHFFEHCENPVATLESFMRVLKPGGILYLIVPDKNYTFDQPRPSTPVEHIVRDFEEGPAWSRRQHYVEYALLVEHALNESDAEARAQYHIDRNYSIHFHVWTKAQMIELLAAVDQKYRLGYALRLFLDNGPEGIYILEKLTAPGSPATVQVPDRQPDPQPDPPHTLWSKIIGRPRGN